MKKGGIIFVDETINLDEVKPEDLYIISVSASVSKDVMIEEVKKHNKKIRKDNGIEEPKSKQTTQKKINNKPTQTQKKNTNSKTNEPKVYQNSYMEGDGLGNMRVVTPSNNNQPVKSRSDLMKGLR